MAFDKFSSFITSIRELLIVAAFLLLLVFPGCLNDILVKAGFTEASVMGFTWKQKAIESIQVADSSQLLAEAALSQIEAMQYKLDSISTKLTQEASETTNPAVDSASHAVAASQQVMQTNAVVLRSKIRLQQTRLNDIGKVVHQRK